MGLNLMNKSVLIITSKDMYEEFYLAIFAKLSKAKTFVKSITGTEKNVLKLNNLRNELSALETDPDIIIVDLGGFPYKHLVCECIATHFADFQNKPESTPFIIAILGRDAFVDSCTELADKLFISPIPPMELLEIIENI